MDVRQYLSLNGFSLFRLFSQYFMVDMVDMHTCMYSPILFDDFLLAVDGVFTYFCPL